MIAETRAKLSWSGEGCLLATILLGAAAAGCGEDDSPSSPSSPHVVPAPVLFRPVAVSTDSVSLSWRGPADGPAYSFVVERRASGESFAPVAASVADTSWVDRNVTPQVRYEYRLLALDASEGMSSPSDTVWVETRDAPPPPVPVMVSPGSDSLDVSSPSEFTWLAGDAVDSDLYLAERPNLTRVAVGIRGSHATRPTVPASGYWWCVGNRGANGVVVLSEIRTFVTAPERFVVQEGWSLMGDSEFFHPGNPVWVQALDVDRFEVTADQFAAFLRTAYARSQIEVVDGLVREVGGQPFCSMDELVLKGGSIEPRAGRGRFPMVGVSWYGAHAYAAHVGRRLPTEAEWEKTARGLSPELGDTMIVTYRDGDSLRVELGLGYPFPWGADANGNRTNHAASGDPFEIEPIGTSPVGYFDGGAHDGYATKDNTSPYGAMDMAGNAAEWTADWYGPYRDPHRPPTSSLEGRVVRGGSWMSPLAACRNAYREFAQPHATSNGIGLRTVKGGESM